MHRPSIPSALAMTLMACAACEREDLTNRMLGATEPESSLREITTAFSTLAVLDAPGGAKLEFRQLDDGTLVVSELVPVGAPSPMDALMTAQGATPLELFLAVAPAGSAIPAALEDAHITWARSRKLDTAPRALSFAPPIGTAAIDGKYVWDYLADCDEPDDRGWFDSFWQTYGWSWHWYDRTNTFSSTSFGSPKNNSVQSHLCNDGPSGSKVHRVIRSRCGSTQHWSYFFTNTVPPEYRSQLRVWQGPSACYWQNSIYHPIGSTRYPTYSHGITTP